VTNDTEIGGGGAVDVMVMDADADLVVSVTEVAVIVTEAGVGTALGAVYVAVPPLAVNAGLIVPHDELPQLTFQVTPALLVSLLTVAITPVLVPTFSEVTGGLRKDTEIGAGGVGPELVPLLHATNQRVIIEAAISWIVFRKFTACLHSGCSKKIACGCVPVIACESANRGHFERRWACHPGQVGERADISGHEWS
jgi:hypothetical protein